MDSVAGKMGEWCCVGDELAVCCCIGLWVVVAFKGWLGVGGLRVSVGVWMVNSGWCAVVSHAVLVGNWNVVVGGMYRGRVI
jgi:hypothetical protein